LLLVNLMRNSKATKRAVSYFDIKITETLSI